MIRDIFKKRVEFKPFEYPEVQRFIDAMNQVFWVHSEVNFDADVQDFKTKLKPHEQECIKRNALAIAQVEVAVKSFWGDLYKVLPKPEFNCLGATFAESESRHTFAYARLIEVLGLDDEFKKLVETAVFKKKLELFDKHFRQDIDFVDKLFFFVIVIENSSLFSQFANILAMSRFKGAMKNIANMIAWTSTEELMHSESGIYILNQIFQEHPEMKKSQEAVEQIIKDYLAYESSLLDWIFEEGEFEWYTKEDMLNFMRFRVDTALEQMGYNKIYNITAEQYSKMKWFDEEVFSGESDDFFAKRPTAYTKHDKPFDAESLF